ncbi:MAG: putative DNA binding domain-containing protein [Rickettsiales bacterium]|jgi:predicted HTH transcriptional regulator|nr:putative DNA binding domain-containing protein [Rickettsiales bacterium]
MTTEELKILIENRENEIVEFKASEAVCPLEGDKKCVIGYCVGIANMKGGYLIIGYNEKTKEFGTEDFQDIVRLKESIYDKSNKKIIVNIKTIFPENRRVVVIKIPSRETGEILRYKGMPLKRLGQQLLIMSDREQNEILSEKKTDWSGLAANGATVGDIDIAAIEKAKFGFSTRHPKISREEIERWDILNNIKKRQEAI